jgi:hypothetical protein
MLHKVNLNFRTIEHVEDLDIDGREVFSFCTKTV